MLLIRSSEPSLNPELDKYLVIMDYQVRCWIDFSHSVNALYICDGVTSCPLGDDELFCSWLLNSTCNVLTEFPCKNGTCISRARQWRNQMVDCWPDGEDERLCHVLKAQPVRFDGMPKEVYLPFNFDRFVLTQRHRGIAIYNDESQLDECLCPPSYSGVHYEQQSECLSISYRVDLPPDFDRSSIYWLVFYLLDGHDRVMTHETHLYTAINQQFSFSRWVSTRIFWWYHWRCLWGSFPFSSLPSQSSVFGKTGTSICRSGLFTSRWYRWSARFLFSSIHWHRTRKSSKNSSDACATDRQQGKEPF